MSKALVVIVALVLYLLIPLTLVFVVLQLRKRNKRVKELEQKLSPVLTVERQVVEAKALALEKIKEIRKDISSTEHERLDKHRKAVTAQKELERITQRLHKVQAELDAASAEHELFLDGFKSPSFSLEDSAAYVSAIKANREAQKTMIRNKRAVTCGQDWEVGGSKREGKKMVNRAIRLTLRAFNNEADLLIKNVTWKNAERSKEKIERVTEILNDLNDSLAVRIETAFVRLKLTEVDLAYEQKLKKEEEKERLRQQREQEREEAKAQREIASEMKRQEKIEREKQNALQEARQRLAIASEAHREALEQEISQMEEELVETMQQKGRLLSMAEQTRIGHVYVISNKGAFGDGIVKIGMTRRLEPLDRVKELGDASVPFPFDVHAMIFSEDAPALEKNLHQAFEAQRVNRVNNRKEFFRVDLASIADAIEQRVPGTPFEKDTTSLEFAGSQQTQELSLPH